MRYAVLIYGGGGYATADEAAIKELYAKHDAFAEKHGDKLRGGMELQGPETARSIRHAADTDSLVTVGPFAETNEVLGGFYMIEADSLDEAVEIAKDVPGLPGDVIEVRPDAKG